MTSHGVLTRAPSSGAPGAGTPVPRDERARARAFVREADRDRYRVAHVVLRRLLGAYLAKDPAAVEFVREPCPRCGARTARPAVAGSPLHFSLWHSGDFALWPSRYTAACALRTDGPRDIGSEQRS
jgi:4'-phosphopantetheinyl transferase